jgi:hypothetical protein
MDDDCRGRPESLFGAAAIGGDHPTADGAFQRAAKAEAFQENLVYRRAAADTVELACQASVESLSDNKRKGSADE